MIRKIAATYLFPVNRDPIKNGILVCGEDGSIIDIIDNGGNLEEESGLEYYSGILVPGFVNTHCHLELSHLSQQIEEKTGIGSFIGKINALRNTHQEQKERLMKTADKRMWSAGISLVGDISNSTSSLQTKKTSKIDYHTFVEAFGFHPSRADRSFDYARSVENEFHENKLRASIVPHSPYSVSEDLFEKIKNNATEKSSIFSIHNQESAGETEFFVQGTGAIADHIKNNLGIDISHFKATKKSSLLSVVKHFPPNCNILLVHNTFTQKNDIQFLKEFINPSQLYFVLCPNSNLYIENQLPPVDLFIREDLDICLGTDSLASNHRLNIVSEMITLQNNFPHLGLKQLIKWATLNGARALRSEKKFGSFEVGKNPGINLISGIDFKNMKLSSDSKVKRLV